MSQQITRISIVPLRNWHYALKASLPFNLGRGFVIQDLSQSLSQVDVAIWNQYISPEEQKQIKGETLCLEHRYQITPEIGEDEKQSERLLQYVAAHLRFLVPNKTNAEYILCVELKSGLLEPFSFTPDSYPLFLEDCEKLCSEIGVQHLEALKAEMSWIVQFRKNWREFYPLFLSLLFSEKAYREETNEVRHLLRVMALEALVSSDTVFGKNALINRLGKLIGTSTDLYAQYRTELQPSLPQLIFGNVIADVCELRNKVAHGDKLPAAWLKRDRRRGELGGSYSLSYADELREAVTSMVSLAWKKIINDGLQSTFGDKAKMEAYFQ